MVVVAVNQYNLKVRLTELVGQFETAKTSAHNDYPFLVCFRKIETHNAIC